MRINYFNRLLKVLLIVTIVFFPIIEVNTSLNKIEDSNYIILTYREMLKLRGGTCGGSGGPCEGEKATDCGSCTAHTVGICRGIEGDCEKDTQQIKCVCDINDYTFILSCDY